MRFMKKVHPEVSRLNTRIFEAQINLGTVLDKAEVHRSTWSRWRKGAVPELETIAKIDRALDQMEQS